MVNKQHQKLFQTMMILVSVIAFIPILAIPFIPTIRVPLLNDLITLIAFIGTGFLLYGVNQLKLLATGNLPVKVARHWTIVFSIVGLGILNLPGIMLYGKISEPLESDYTELNRKNAIGIASLIGWLSMGVWLVIFIRVIFNDIWGPIVGLLVIAIMVINFFGFSEIKNAKKGLVYPELLKKWGVYFIFTGFIVVGMMLLKVRKSHLESNTDLSTMPPHKPILKRWLSFNSQSIPLLIGIVAVFYFTGTIDFEIREVGFVWQAHIHAITRLSGTYGSLAMFLMFLIYILALVQVFNYVTFRQKRNPMSFYLITALSIIQVGALAWYIFIFLTESSRFSTYSMTTSAYNSIILFGIGTILSIISNFFAFKYVNWEYVRLEE